MSEVTHKEIMEKAEENSALIAELRADLSKVSVEVGKVLELVEAYSALKTGGKFVTWMAKFLAGLLAIWVFIKGSAQLLVELGKN